MNMDRQGVLARLGRWPQQRPATGSGVPVSLRLAQLVEQSLTARCVIGSNPIPFLTACQKSALTKMKKRTFAESNKVKNEYRQFDNLDAESFLPTNNRTGKRVTF